MHKPVALLIIISLILSVETKNWAVLVAGSNSYSNYRHQSDVFHAYHILTKNGIPKSNIIVMAYDDIAHNRQNPTPGKVCNKPNGSDVYSGVTIDYKGSAVSATNFLNIIKGNKAGVKGGNGKVVNSTSADNIFIYYTDHGADNMVAFPVGRLTAADLNAALNTMHTNKKYNKLLFYLEACYSGSMFEGRLTANKNIFATTAANSHQSSYAFYCGNQATCGGRRVGSCLGDEYSVHWMEDSDKANVWSRTVGQQTDTVKKQTTKSVVCQFGATAIRSDVLGVYQGHKGATTWNKFLQLVDDDGDNIKNEDVIRIANVDHYLYYLKEQAEMNNDQESWDEYKTEVLLRERSNMIFKRFKEHFNLPDVRNKPLVNDICFKNTMKWHEELCGFNIERDAKYVTYMASFCTMKHTSWDAFHYFKKICRGE